MSDTKKIDEEWLGEEIADRWGWHGAHYDLYATILTRYKALLAAGVNCIDPHNPRGLTQKQALHELEGVLRNITGPKTPEDTRAMREAE